MIIKDVGFAIAFWGGFSSFFSIWQLCLMQITPFFLAFAVGLYMLEPHPLPLGEGRGEGSATVRLLMACAGYILGFSVVFALMGTSGWRAAAYILYNIDDFRIAAAAYITAIALLMIAYNLHIIRIPSFDKLRTNVRGEPVEPQSRYRILYLPVGLLLGASFALAYSPCIPPVMSDIMNFAGKPANAHQGFHLLVVYGFGVTLAFAISGVILSLAAGYFIKGKSARDIIVYLSSGALLVMTFLLITDLMIRYKSLLVGFVLD